MKIAISIGNDDVSNEFIRQLNGSHQVIVAKVENVLFEQIETEEVDAFIISNEFGYFKKAVDFIKKKNPYTPVIGITHTQLTLNVPADVYMDLPMSDYSSFVAVAMHNINTYVRTFATLKRLTTKLKNKIEFANCVYDPSRRLLYYKEKEIKKLSTKEGGILEILASNYGEVVKKDLILEKVWRKNDYFSGRSMDVYLSYIRNTFKNNNMNLSIKNISGIGLILE